MPAMTKGFLDKVYAKGQLYTADTMQTTLTQHPQIRVITTMSTPIGLIAGFWCATTQGVTARDLYEDATMAL
ncbi:NAD(P)H-dependent oxidoreductase [Levilactobacillus brevis]|nr:NAD(P)H-dependent oxidoreductase [Levilactobacillus brevis]